MKKRPLLALCLGALGLSGCALPAPFTASSADYGAYRETRVAATTGARLAAAQRYLTTRPDGRFVSQVNAFLHDVEPQFYEVRESSVGGLEDYLRWLPEGPHAKEAARKLTAMRESTAPDGSLVGAASAIEARLNEAAEARKAVLHEVDVWLGRLADPAIFGRSFAEAPGETVVAWSLSLPTAICRPVEPGPDVPADHTRRCVKILELSYSIPVQGVSEERQATVELEMIQNDAGWPVETAIQGPELFARLEEARANEPVMADDTQAKARAFAGIVGNIQRRAFGGDASYTCKESHEEGDGRTGFIKTCDGLTLRAIPSPGGGRDDRVVIAPNAAK